MQGGRLKHRVTFEREAKTDAGGGAADITWSAVVTVWAGFRPQFGREQIEAGSLESTLRGTLTVRTSSTARGITAADRAVFVAGPHTGTACQIRSIVPLHDRIEMTLESGVGT